jgi:predicted nucleic acid-binding protein
MEYVLDTTAVMSVLMARPGHEPVVEVLERAGRGDTVLLPFMTLMELEYGLLRAIPRHEADDALRLVEAWPAEIAESSPAWRHRAAEVKSQGGLSLADAWIAALALMRNATLLHHDPEFDHVEGLSALPLR